jgi:hypothetical protein
VAAQVAQAALRETLTAVLEELAAQAALAEVPVLSNRLAVTAAMLMV